MADQQMTAFEAFLKRELPDHSIEEIAPGTLNLARNAWTAALSHAEGEPVDWDDAQAICDLPEVHDCLQCFSEDSTGDNGTEVVRAVMNACRDAMLAPAPDEREVMSSEGYFRFLRRAYELGGEELLDEALATGVGILEEEAARLRAGKEGEPS